MAYSPFIMNPAFFAISDFSEFKIAILPFQFVTKSEPLHIGHWLPSTKILSFEHAFLIFYLSPCLLSLLAFPFLLPLLPSASGLRLSTQAFRGLPASF